MNFWWKEPILCNFEVDALLWDHKSPPANVSTTLKPVHTSSLGSYLSKNVWVRGVWGLALALSLSSKISVRVKNANCGRILSSQAPSVSSQVVWLCAGTIDLTLTVLGSSECVLSLGRSFFFDEGGIVVGGRQLYSPIFFWSPCGFFFFDTFWILFTLIHLCWSKNFDWLIIKSKDKRFPFVFFELWNYFKYLETFF